jgi:2-haloacid dehalogenase
MDVTQVKALIFDVFGTVVDWRSSVIAEGEALGRAKGLQVDWSRFADEWRLDGYIAGMDAIRRGDAPWANVDTLHRRKLDELLVTYGITGLDEAEVEHFNRVWHRLAPWPDSVAGLTRLRKKFVISTFSNGNFALLTNMAKHAGLPWDCIISAELFRTYKPEPATYLGAVALLGLRAEQVMLVAAHPYDCAAARDLGLRAGYVSRPLEFGPKGVPEGSELRPLKFGPSDPHGGDPAPDVDILADDFLDLAAKLGA